MSKLTVGEPIPYFEANNQDEKPISSKSLLGKSYVMFFYPKDDSPGCTKEACSIRDDYRKIQKAGYEVYGVSPDHERKHRKFIDKYEFQFDLLADPDKEIIQAFGLWGPKKFMGREITGVYRTTILVNQAGIIEAIIDKVKTKEHASQILNAINEVHSLSQV